mmetsp:Transcript_78016/g.137476  ORF Transcript_78016/g.137476 Transcript_78016/m.137476 type:complete len:211 (+) Transcript_78016:22-654(+)|eukprot:CAMPEP_0197662030 /NCGR_PEP_ID=MMETSP1338-20131121/51912_1 /TAXON_ID=43686 ORGANISM="Pelagodinium beii, Strain RCC1491" /NCGR_SAMPLE_ID=MMETSP1338 /ASSEMBLY_ACC=CAM_ASM_000754 /LENGTH=210 /DNA_ID=CAMNT_0043239709 /DNA_START=20 /DNA_END=652 /DNA_ORIENTATION=+
MSFASSCLSRMEAQVRVMDTLLASLRASKSVPVALLQPRAESLNSLRGQLCEALLEAKKQPGLAALGTPEEIQELASKEANLTELLQKLGLEIQAEPWFNPPAQRRLLKVERQLVECCDVLCRMLRGVCRKECGPFKCIRVVNMKDPDDVKASGMDAEEVKREGDRLGSEHGIEKIVMTASGCSGKGLAEVFGPKAHCATTVNRIMHCMS